MKLSQKLSVGETLLKDHFPDGAIVPAALLIQEIEAAFSRAHPNLILSGIEKMRLAAPAKPNEDAEIEIELKTAEKAHVSVRQSSVTVLSGHLIIGASE